jgi:hypothetical protein
MRWFSCAFVVMALLVSGCAFNDHFENRARNYDIATEQARDEMLLTNVVRASRAEPLAFQQLGQIAGSSTTGGTMGLPSLIFGPRSGLPVGAAGLQNEVAFGALPGAMGFMANSASTSGSTTFNLTPAETQDFYRGLLVTVSPETLGFFRDQGIAREILYYLFTDKVSETKDGVVRTFENDPISESFAGFQTYVRLAMEYGLSSEANPGYKPPIQSGTKTGGEGGAHITEVASSAEWRLCFDRTLAKKPFRGNRPICGSKDKLADERTVSFLDSQGALTLAKVYPRSTFSIFEYLGRLVAEGDAGRIQLITEEAMGKPPLFDDIFFYVTPGTVGGGCFLFVDYAGRSYCVPEDGALNTKRILGLLAQLLALNTSVRDITSIPQVQVLPQ